MTTRRMNKQNVAFSYHGEMIQPQKRKEVLTEATTWMVLENIVLKWQKWDKKGHVLHDAIYMKNVQK